jgi:hypothetical protein
MFGPNGKGSKPKSVKNNRKKKNKRALLEFNFGIFWLVKAHDRRKRNGINIGIRKDTSL